MLPSTSDNEDSVFEKIVPVNSHVLTRKFAKNNLKTSVFLAVDRHNFYDHRILIVVDRRQQKDFYKRSFSKLGNIVHHLTPSSNSL